MNTHGLDVAYIEALPNDVRSDLENSAIEPGEFVEFAEKWLHADEAERRNLRARARHLARGIELPKGGKVAGTLFAC